MKRILLVTAMDKEYEIISKSLQKSWKDKNGMHGYLRDKLITILKTGIGKVNAASNLSEILSDIKSNSKIERVIAIGCAGAAIPSLKVGDIVIGNSYCYHDVYCGESNENGQVQGMPAVFPSSFMWINGVEKYKLGTIATGDWFVNTREKVESILNFLPKAYNVCAIDMESTALAQVCYNKTIEFTSIRVISDNPLLPNHQEQYDSFWDDMADKCFNELVKMLSK